MCEKRKQAQEQQGLIGESISAFHSLCKGQLHHQTTLIIPGNIQSIQQEEGTSGQLGICLHRKAPYINYFLNIFVFPIKQRQIFIIQVEWAKKDGQESRQDQSNW